jgi:hypothetical protein
MNSKETMKDNVNSMVRVSNSNHWFKVLERY